MKVPLHRKNIKRIPGKAFGWTTFCLLVSLFLGMRPSSLMAEGSVDFIGYDGYRMFLDTRDDQQLKVYAKAGETINVGSSHVGIQGGFIRVYDPDGNLVITYDNTGVTTGLAIIDNNIEELSGPTGGGTTNGPGYEPGTILVMPGDEGVWTVIFDYPSYTNAGYTNILNSAPWTRAVDQPNTRRVVLAWDITVTTGGAGNQGGTPETGRVYSNEHISLIDGNGFTTSPVFYVLTEDAYLYQVNIMEADPFRFPISSNSLGLVDGNLNPIYKSKPESDFTRSADPSGWDVDSIYLYEPQAEGLGQLKNNKIFFNIPDTSDLPEMAMVTDIFRNNPHETWLWDTLEIIQIDSIYLEGTSNGGTPCAPGVIEFGKGGLFYFTTNIGGVVTLQLDIDNNGIFTDSIDVTIMGSIAEGVGTLFWDGNDGFGNPIAVQDSFILNYQGNIRYGELHIALTDVEGNPGGVTFEWLNAPPGEPDSLFYYDHTDIGGPVSGGGTPGNALPTSIPYTYPLFEGNDKYVDQWFFIQSAIANDSISVNVVLDCACDPGDTPDLVLSGADVCSGEPLTITATNQTPALGNITYDWTGPDGYVFSEVVAPGDTSVANVTTEATLLNAGTYQVIGTTSSLCADTATISIGVTVTPLLTTGQDSLVACEGDSVQFCAQNVAPIIGTINCQWTGPNGFFATSSVSAIEDICLNLTNVSSSMAGEYYLICSFGTCISDTLTFSLGISPTPEINGISPNDDFCIGDDVYLSASNVVSGTGPITYTWSGPNGFMSVGTAPESGPFPDTIFNIQPGQEGVYTLILESAQGCQSTLQAIQVGLLPTPEICNVSGDGDACIGQTITLSAFNCGDNVVFPVTYTWAGPNGILCTNQANDDGPYECDITNIQGIDAGNYTLTVESANGCAAAPVTVTVNVVPGLNIIDVTPDSTYCPGSDVVLSASNTVNAGQVVYTWTGPNGFICTVGPVNWDEPFECIIPNVTDVNAGNYTLNVTSDAGCVSAPVTVFVGVYPDFEILTVTGDGSYCTGDTLFLNGTGSGAVSMVDYVWIDPSGDTIASGMDVLPAGPFPGMDPTPQTGTYTLVVTTPDGCDDSATVIIDVGETPLASIITNDTILCELDTFTICAQNLNPNIGFFTYTWVTPNGITISGAGNGTDVFCDELLPLATYGSGTYYLTLNADNCISGQDSVTIDLNPNPVISSISGGGSYCVGDTATVCFTNTNPAVDSFYYTCILPGGISITDIAATGDTICLDLTEPGIIFCSLESVDGCVSSLASVQVSFDSGFDLTLTADDTLCANETLFLDGINTAPCTGDATYTWTGPNGFTFTGTAPCEGPFPATVDNPVSGDYCLSVESNTGNCSGMMCITVTVLDIPFVLQSTINGGGVFCEGDLIELTATIENPSGGDIDYTWTQDGTPVLNGTAPSGSTISLILNNATTLTSGEYCLELTCSDTGCQSNGDDCTTVTVNVTPVVDEVTGDGTYCEGDDVQLDGSGPAGPGDVTYTWTGPNGFTFSGTAPCGGPYPATVDNIQVNQSGVYTLVVMKGDCTSEEATVNVTVNPTPDIINVSSGGEECAGSMITIAFTIDPDGAASVDWTIDGPGLNESGTVTDQTSFMYDITVDGDATYTITAVSDLGCEADPETITITEVMIPVPVVTTSASVLCPGDALELTTDMVAGATYNWFQDGNLIGTTTEPVFNVVPPVAGNYSVEVVLSGCSETSAEVTVTEPTAPDAVDDSFTGSVNDPITGNILENDDTGSGVTINIVQEPSLGTVTIDQDGNIDYIATSPGTDEFVYELCLVDCPDVCDEATVTIVVTPDECIIPNIITPNQDGANDVLFIECLQNENFPNNSLRIFNRWGDELEIFEPYDNTWDGTVGSDKEPVPAGTYFYLFYEDRDNEDNYQAGYVKVVR